MAGGIEFNPSKFKELVLLLSELSADDPLISRVKLNKLLYRADSEAFRLLGASISGATYVKGEFGPMATELPFAEERLGERGYLSYEIDESGPYPRKIPRALTEADRSQFSDAEISIVEAAVEELSEHGGKSASEWSHREWAGWRITPDDEVIPYPTVIIASEPGPPATVERLREAVLSGNWEIDR